MENTITNAIKFIKEVDKELGEGWSDGTETLAQQLVNYAKLCEVYKNPVKSENLRHFIP